MEDMVFPVKGSANPDKEGVNMPTIQNRRATAAQWTAANPVLAAGEIGFELDTNKTKVGNGLTPWKGLSYFIDEDTVLEVGNVIYGTKAEVAQVEADLDAAKLDKSEAAKRYTTPAQVETLAGMSVAPLVPPLVADAIAADGTVAQSAAAAAQGAIAAAGQRTFFAVRGASLLLANPEFATEPGRTATGTVGAWYNAVDPEVQWGPINDGPNGTQNVVRLASSTRYIQQIRANVSADGLAGKQVECQIVARAVPAEGADHVPLRLLVDRGAIILDRRLGGVTGVGPEWTTVSATFTIPLDIGAYNLKFALALHSGNPAGSKLAEVASVRVFVPDEDVRTIVDRRVIEAMTEFAPPPASSSDWVAGKAYAVGDIAVTSRGDRLRCVTAHTSSARFTDDLPKWRAVDMPAQESMMLQIARQAKGGGIGIGDKAAFALRFDDDHIALHSNVYPMLLERGFPAGHATIADLSQQPWADTAALVVERNRHGIETWSHGHDHKDPSPHGMTGAGGLVDQIVNSRSVIESWGVKCQGWMQPGATPTVPGVTPYGTTFQSVDDLNSYAGLLIRQTYPLSEMYLSNVYRSIPTGLYHGLDHVTISDGMGYEAAVNVLDMVVQRRLGLEFMVHSAQLGQPGRMTVAQLEQILDLVVAYWEAGDLEVLTPSGLIFADRTDSRLDLVQNGSFKTAGAWTLPASVEVSSGGRTGNCLHFGPSVGSSASQNVTYLRSQRYAGETFLFEGWTRSTGGTGTARVYLDDPQDSSRLNLLFTSSEVGTEWTRIRHAFTIPPQSDQLRLRIGHSGTTGGDWDDVTILKV